jgi:hypothetical protein
MAVFDQSWLNRVPPPPPRAYDDPTFRTGFERLQGRELRDLAGVWYWTSRIETSWQEVEERVSTVAAVSRVSIGFIPALDGAFGVLVHTEPTTDFDTAALSRSRGDDYGDWYVNVEGQSFPVSVESWTREQHWCTAPEVTAPTAARAACWVQSTIRGYQGWLVPRHAVTPFTNAVAFSDGGTGRVIDHFGECVDAAVVMTTQPPTGRQRTQACWPVVAGQPLLVTDAPKHHQQAYVMDVDMNLGVLRSAIFPVRFSTDWAGQPGHSGSLALDPSTGEPAGMYLGLLRPTQGSPTATSQSGPVGYAQSCWQLSMAAGLEYYV